MKAIIDNWWRNPKLISRQNGLANLLTGIGCLVCVGADWRLGLGSLGRWYLGYFALLCLPWGLLALRYGQLATAARPLRLAGDIGAWIAFIGFALIGLALNPAEYAALWTLLVVVLITAATWLLNRRSQPALA